MVACSVKLFIFQAGKHFFRPNLLFSTDSVRVGFSEEIAGMGLIPGTRSQDSHRFFLLFSCRHDRSTHR
jgi:hypothetical protein